MLVDDRSDNVSPPWGLVMEVLYFSTRKLALLILYLEKSTTNLPDDEEAANLCLNQGCSAVVNLQNNVSYKQFVNLQQDWPFPCLLIDLY